MIGEEYCVQGIVTSITRDNGTRFTTRMYFENLMVPPSATGRPTPFYFVDDVYDPVIGVNDCVGAVGTLQMNNDGEYFIWIEGDLETCSP